MNKLVIKHFIKNNKIFLIVICILLLCSFAFMISTILIAQNEIDKKNSYKKKIANYSKKNASLKTKNQDLKKTVEELQSNVSSFSQRLNKLILDSEKYSKETKETLREISEIDALKDETIRKLNKDFEDKKTLLESTSQELSFFQTTLRERDSKILELQTKQNDIARKALERNNEEWEKIQTPAAKEVRQLKRDIESLQKERDKHKKNADSYWEDYERASGEVIDADNDAKAYKDEIEKLKKDKAQLKQKIAELEKKEAVNDDENRK